MSRYIAVILLLISATGCYTPLRSISRHPEKYVNKIVLVRGYAARWYRNDHGFYFIVVTNRYGRYPVIVYKQMPYITFKTPVKAHGRLRSFKADRQTFHIIIDSTQAYKTFLFSKDTLRLSFRDTLPPDCSFFIQNSF